MATQRIVFLSFVFIFNATFKNHLLSSTHLLWLLVGIVAAIWIRSFFNSLYRKYCACVFVFIFQSDQNIEKNWSKTHCEEYEEHIMKRMEVQSSDWTTSKSDSLRWWWSIFFPYTVKCRLLVTQRYTECSDKTRLLLVSRNNNFSIEHK